MIVDYDLDNFPLHGDESFCADTPISQWNNHQSESFLKCILPKYFSSPDNMNINGSLLDGKIVNEICQKGIMTNEDLPFKIKKTLNNLNNNNSDSPRRVNIAESPFYSATIRLPTNSSSWLNSKNINLIKGVKYSMDIQFKSMLDSINIPNSNINLVRRLLFRLFYNILYYKSIYIYLL